MWFSCFAAKKQLYDIVDTVRMMRQLGKPSFKKKVEIFQLGVIFSPFKVENTEPENVALKKK